MLWILIRRRRIQLTINDDEVQPSTQPSEKLLNHVQSFSLKRSEIKTFRAIIIFVMVIIRSPSSVRAKMDLTSCLAGILHDSPRTKSFFMLFSSSIEFVIFLMLIWRVDRSCYIEWRCVAHRHTSRWRINVYI